MSDPNAGAPSPSRYRDGARAIAPIGVASFLFGVSFGVLARAAGLGELPPIVMSLTAFAGSAQFAALSVLDAGGAAVAAVVAGLLLNGRYAVLGLSVAPSLEGGRLRRFVSAQMVVDENWAISHQGEGRFDRKVLLGAGLTLYACWNVGTVLGVVLGDALGDPGRLGLDAAFPALFLALLVGQLSTSGARRTALVGAAVALVLVPIAPAGVPVIAAAAVCLAGAVGNRRERT